MRATLAAVLIVAFCAIAPGAFALNQPPIGLQSLRVIKLVPHSKHKTCTARSRSHSKVARATGKLTTTACEQPPRVKGLLTSVANALVIP
ncbi:MAG: hypothetical protein QOF43_2120 [Gaiellaceae bacterium]|nr:hypothetical protein [Gaiellaceae bacterium]